MLAEYYTHIRKTPCYTQHLVFGEVSVVKRVRLTLLTALPEPGPITTSFAIAMYVYLPVR
eukprot:987001-Pyramimonas_sp.AAC.2